LVGFIPDSADLLAFKQLNITHLYSNFITSLKS